MKRRNLLLGLGGLAGAGGIVGSGAFSSISANRDVTVAVAKDTDALLKLEPSPTANGEYAKKPTQNGGLIALDFSNTDEGGKGPGTDSIYTFDDIFRVTNQGTQPVYVWGTFDGAAGNFTASGDDTDIWLYPDGDSQTKLRDNGDGVVRLGVGDTVRIGVYVDTHDVTSDQELTMTINATVDKPAGAPGTTKPYPPISVSKSSTQTRYFHALPNALDYASGGDGVVVGVEEGTYPRDIDAIRVTDPVDPRNWIEYERSLDEDVLFTSNDDSDCSIAIQRSEFGFTSEPWLVTVKEDKGSTKTVVHVGLSELLDPTVTTVDGDELTITKNGQTSTVSGGEKFVFSRDGNSDQTVSLTAADDGSGKIEQVTLTTADAALSFTNPSILETAPELVVPIKRELSLRVPDSFEIKGLSGRPKIEHAITVNTESTQEKLRFQNLRFGEPPEKNDDGDDVQQSVAIESLDDGAVRNLQLNAVEFMPPDGRIDGVRIEPSVSAVNGLEIIGCDFEGRIGGIQAIRSSSLQPAQITEFTLSGSTFRDNDFGINVSNITEGYVENTDFIDNGRGINMDTPTAFGLEGVTFERHDVTAFKYSGNLASVSEPPELSEQIESNVGDGTLGMSGIVDSTFVSNVKNVYAFGIGSDNYPVAADCTFTPKYTADDIEEF